MSKRVIDFCGQALVPDISGALYWPRARTLFVADLHFEKSTSYADRFQTLPPYDTRATLRELSSVIEKFKPSRVVALGDSFHDGGAEVRFDADDADTLKDLTAKQDWIWICGNHDPGAATSFGGKIAEELELAPLTLRHEPLGDKAGEIAGHYHPCAAIRSKGRRLRRKCFAHAPGLIILPSFGAFTGGLNVCDPAYGALLGSAFHAWMIGRDDIYPIKSQNLLPDPDRSRHEQFYQRAD